jgi:hypothetical protein
MAGSGIGPPIRASAYQLMRALPAALDTSLPSIEAFGAELAGAEVEL